MWKYVGQRLKDSAELTCSHIKNLRSTFSTCPTKTNEDSFSSEDRYKRLDITKDDYRQIYNVWTSLNEDKKNSISKKNPFDIDTPYIIQKCYQKQKQKQQDAFNGWIEFNFLQWVCK